MNTLFNCGFLGNSPFVDLSYVTTSRIDKLFIDVRNTSVIINPTTNNEITIEYKENNKYQYNITEENGTLLIIQKDLEFDLSNFSFNINTTSPKFIINVPEGIIYGLSIKTSNNTIQVNDLKTTNIKFETSNGIIIAKSITTNNKIDIRTSNAKIDLINITSEDIILKTSNGKIELDNVNCTNNIEAGTSSSSAEIKDIRCNNMNIKTSSGKIDLVNINANDIILETSSGKIELDNVNCTNNIKAKTSSSSVVTKDTNCYDMNIKTSSGKIDLVNINANDIILETSNGKIELDNVNCANNIKAKTSSSSVVTKDTNCYDMNINTSNGAINLSNLTIKNNIIGSTSNNKITLDRVDFSTNLDLTTSNGSISGDIKGKLSDFSFKCKTSNHNKSNLPESLISGAKMIKLETTNSNINIDFS